MSKHESFPDVSEATPVEAVDMKFDDPKLQEYFGGPKTEAEATEVSDTPEKTVPNTPEKPQEESAAELQYKVERSAWKQAKANYAEAKDSYETRLTEYYKNYSDKGIFGRGTQKFGEWWNGKPEDLQDLESEFKNARGAYALSLENVLGSRGESSEQNNNFDKTALDSKKAFAQKFVLNPRKDQIELQKEHLVDTKTAERATALLQTLSKHKWAVRVGVVTATGVAVGTGAGLAAGLGAAGYRAARMAGGVAGGVIGAKIGDRIGREGIEVAKENLTKTQEDTVAEFTVENIDKLETALVDAENTVDKKEQQRKYAIIAGAIVGGGSLANLDRITDAAGEAIASPAYASIPDEPVESSGVSLYDLKDKIKEIPNEPTLPETAPATDGASETEIGALSADTLKALEDARTDAEAKEIAEEAMHVLEETRVPGADAEADAIAAEAMRILEETRPEINIGDHMVAEGDTLWKITKESFARQLEGLSEAQKNQVLDAVFDDLRKDPALATQLGIKSGNIDLIYPQDNLKMSVLESLVDEKVVAIGSPEAVPAGSYVVEKNDNLWNITKENFSGKLASLSEADRNNVLSAVFDDLRKNPELTESLGIRSGNIDLIYPDDTLKISLLEPLLEEKLAALENGTMTAPTEVTPTEVTEPAIRPAIEAETTPKTEPVRVAENTAGDTEIRPRVFEMEDGRKGVLTEELRAFQGSHAEYTKFFESKGAEVFGSERAFDAAQKAAVEEIVGKQPRTFSITGNKVLNPVYERVKMIPLQVLKENGALSAQQLDRGMAMRMLPQMGLDATEANYVDLQKWHAFYKDAMRSGNLQAEGIVIKPNMTFEHLFMQYIIANHNR